MSKPKVVMIMAMSADGCITNQKDGFVDWTSKEDKKHFVAATKAAGVLIYGRKTFELHKKPLPNRLNVIMTRTPNASENIPGQLEFTNMDPVELVENLWTRGFTTIALTGGAEINAQFLDKGLVDELYLTIEPKLFGAGKRLFNDIHKEFQLELLDTQMLNKHSILLHYKIIR